MRDMIIEMINAIILGVVYCVGYTVGFLENLIRLFSDWGEE